MMIKSALTAKFKTWKKLKTKSNKISRINSNYSPRNRLYNNNNQNSNNNVKIWNRINRTKLYVQLIK